MDGIRVVFARKKASKPFKFGTGSSKSDTDDRRKMIDYDFGVDDIEGRRGDAVCASTFGTKRRYHRFHSGGR
ncbi:hypothetical protein RRF57_004224 [Xylaria bambusicola]|uniref:Uncharacterized protein n=1 Tax=Xylaria bambusicola TaxID=326684 RepID=A0AAN7UA94_9PEZI